ncbi:MAG TPA: ABC transporter ATP-binding protein [Acidimicrobiales bacterium]|nr:ABC transporter ATP-binding protein [Acidimicrobiales bacterium]
MTALPDLSAAPVGEGVELAVQVEGLTKRYGDLFAVRDLALSVPRGAIFGLIGPNGAGKSTTFLVLASLLAPTAGRVRVAGHDPVENPRAVRATLGYMPDVMGVYDNLRVDEYLEFFAGAYRLPRSSWPGLIDGLLELVDLAGKRRTMVDSLSRGMKQRLSLARALVHDPEVLVLDEPASGLDPRARVELRELLVQLRDMGKTVVISSHILAELEEMCTEVAILEAGRLLAVGSPRSIGDQLGGARAVRVRLAGGEVQEHTVGSEEEQQALLARLVAEGLPVVEFTETSNGLEDLFLRVTKGVVQ